jgi:hypothetical protein
MDWTLPTYEEIKMDAEIGSYQQDEDRGEVPFVQPQPDVPAAAE